MATSWREPTTAAVTRLRSAHRQYRLHRGAARWQQDLNLTRTRVDRVLFGTLTFASGDQAAARGAIKKFWDAVEHELGPQRRFWMMELQERKQVHYHFWWINPPPRWTLDITSKLRKWWPHGFTKQRWWTAHDWRRLGIAYVHSYLKKHGPKRHQQAYEDLVVNLRTFGTQRLRFRASELDAHRNGWIAAYVPDRRFGGEHEEEHLELVGRRTHVPRDLVDNPIDLPPPIDSWAELEIEWLPGSVLSPVIDVADQAADAIKEGAPPPWSAPALDLGDLPESKRLGPEWCALFATRSYRALDRRARRGRLGRRQAAAR